MLALLLASVLNVQAKLVPGQIIVKSCRFAKCTVSAPNQAGTGAGAAITIRGKNLVVDFGGLTLRGSAQDTQPDQRQGTALKIEGKNITIRNLNAHGYKLGVFAKNCPGLRILDCDFSYNWKQHLLSTTEREDESDWMSFHHNEKDEWLGYGAGIYLRSCNGFEVKNTTIEGGQCGLMLTDCNQGKVWNNNFSFLSAIGIGMYRCSENKIMHNNIDWCVRGYSHGVYNRGQDSAGILIYEQSNRNTFAYNSVTHGGDGFFLWAGQTTMDDGSGGCNGNLIYGNDFSHAPTNGIEATFSRNEFVNNLVLECWHGVWGGYSWESRVIGNLFGYNGQGIAWEHGQDNMVHYNVFTHDNQAISIWQNPTQDPNWGYPKNRDTKSHAWGIMYNFFYNIASPVVAIRDSEDVSLVGNWFRKTNPDVAHLSGKNPKFQFVENVIENATFVEPSGGRGTKTNLMVGVVPSPAVMAESGNPTLTDSCSDHEYALRFQQPWLPFTSDPMPKTHPDWLPYLVSNVKAYEPKPLKGGKRPFLKPGTPRGRRFIFVDEWGPYDFKSPKLWPSGATSDTQRLRILGPVGKWKIVSLEGIAKVSTSTGDVPGEISITPMVGSNLVKLVLSYQGAQVVTPFGEVIPAGKPSQFSFSRFHAAIDWQIKFFAWDSKTDPRSQTEAYKALIAGPALKEVHKNELNYASGGAFEVGLPSNQFITVADGEVNIAPGNYVLNVVTDDGCRVWLDGKLIISDAWKYQGPTPYSANVALGGKHRIHVEHFEIDGYSALKVDLKPRN